MNSVPWRRVLTFDEALAEARKMERRASKVKKRLDRSATAFQLSPYNPALGDAMFEDLARTDAMKREMEARHRLYQQATGLPPAAVEAAFQMAPEDIPVPDDPMAEPIAAARRAKPNKAALLAEAERLGIDVPDRATVEELRRLIPGSQTLMAVPKVQPGSPSTVRRSLKPRAASPKAKKAPSRSASAVAMRGVEDMRGAHEAGAFRSSAKRRADEGEVRARRPSPATAAQAAAQVAAQGVLANLYSRLAR